MAEREFAVSFWRRPLTAMTEAIWASGFVIERLTGPQPVAELQTQDPGAYATLSTKPRFLFFPLRSGLGVEAGDTEALWNAGGLGVCNRSLGEDPRADTAENRSP